MDRELIDRVWKILPAEYREEVKKMWQSADKEQQLPHDAFLRGNYSTLVSLFGYDNLTSDAEGEEMLMVKAKTVREMYAYNAAILSLDPTHKGAILLKKKLQALFGSKCLPDDAHEDNFTSKEPTLKRGDIVRVTNARHSLYEGLIGTVDTVVKGECPEILVNHRGSLISFHASELKPYEDPKPAEPKFKVGDKVRILSLHGRTTPDKGEVDVIAHINIRNREQMYYLENHYHCAYGFSESDLEPYTEPKEDKHFDNIIKDSFADHNRLHIAAIAMAGLLANEGVSCFTDIQELEHMDFITYHAFEYADKLIKQSKKGDEDG